VNLFQKKYSNEIDKILAKYPPEQKRAAVMPLLHLAQRENGFVSRQSMKDIAEISEISITDVASVVGYYTLYHDSSDAKIRLQVCTDVACDLRGAKEYLREVCGQLGIQEGQTTPDGLIMIEEVKCLAACDRAPMFQSQIGDELEYHENQTPGRTLDWIRSMISSMTGSSSELVKKETIPGDNEVPGGGSHE
jgi:NADH-quinone oxidoreductase subunit E